MPSRGGGFGPSDYRTEFCTGYRSAALKIQLEHNGQDLASASGISPTQQTRSAGALISTEGGCAPVVRDQTRFQERALLHEIFELGHDEDHGGTERHQDDRRKDQEEDRKDQFDADFAGRFLRLLAEADAQVARVIPQRRREARAEAVGVDEQIRELFEFRFAVAFGKCSGDFPNGWRQCGVPC